MKILLLGLIVLSIVACENPFKKKQVGGGGGGGSIPSSEEINDYLNDQMQSEIPKCSNLSIDEQLSIRKFPIIKTNGRNSWPDSYSEAIGEQFDKPYMRPLREQKLKESDLATLDCKGYNYATPEEKKKFWAIYMSAIAYPESSLDTRETFKEPAPDNTISAGLLQIDWESANRWCGDLRKDLGMSPGQDFTTNQMLDPKINLQCGMIMMQRSTTGVIKKEQGRFFQSRPDLKGSLFSDQRWYWKVLESGKRYKVINWFKVHAKRQLPFCERTSHEVTLAGETHTFEHKSKLQSWPKISCDNLKVEDLATCEMKKTAESSEDELINPGGSDLNLGEKNPTKDESCNLVEDGPRNPSEPKRLDATDSSTENEISDKKARVIEK